MYIVPALLTICMLIAIPLLDSGDSDATTTVMSGSCGDRVNYVLDSDGVLTISGNGDMDDYLWTPYDSSYTTTAPWGESHYSSVRSVSIEDGVTSIGNNSFYGCTSLASVVLPSSIESIGESAFYDCTSLRTVYNLSSLTIGERSSSYGHVGYYADKVFSKGSQTCGSGVYWAIYGDELHIYGYGDMSDFGQYSVPWYTERESVRSVEFAGSVTSIGRYAFYGCTSLASITMPDSITSIGWYAFSGCTSMSSAVISDSITSIGDETFSGCTSLKSAEIPGYVTSIGWYAFSGCTSLASAVIPGSVTSIGEFAFYCCTSLRSVSLPASVEFVGSGAFSGCTSLASFSGTYEGVDGVLLLSYDGEVLLSCAAGPSVTSVTIPDCIRSIGAYAFYGCSSLASVTLPPSVESIGTYAFSGCTSLVSVVLSPSVESIGSQAFQNCTSLKTVYNLSTLVVEKGSSSYGDVGYYADRIFSESSQACGDCVYWYLDGDTLFVYGYGAMTNYSYPSRVPWNSVCTSVKSVEFIGCVTTVGAYAFSSFTSLSCIALPASVTSIGSNAFSGCTSLSDVALSDIVESIGQYAFFGCTSLASISLPASVTSIGSSAFFGCTSLDSVTIPISVTSIGAQAFSGCTSFVSIVLPDSVISIGSAAFSGCTSLKSVTLSASLTSIGDSLFEKCTALTVLEMPASVTSIKACAFQHCTSLESVIISPSVISIGRSAFEGCTSLTSVTIPGSVTSIETKAFFGCTSLKTVCNISALAIEIISTSYGHVGYYADRVLSASTYTCGDSVYWAVDRDVLYVFGHGDMSDFDYKSSTSWYNRCSQITSVSVEYGVTSVGEYAFSGFHGLVGVDLSNTVTSIKKYAFWNTEVESISFGTGLKYVATDAFIGYTFCDGLIENTDYKHMSGCTFKGSDNNFTTVSGKVGEGVAWSLDTVEGRLVISGNGEMCDFTDGSFTPWYPICETIVSVEFVGSVLSIGKNTFQGCNSLTSATLSDSITSIGSGAFFGCTSLISVTLPDSLTSIGSGAFSGCTSLDSFSGTYGGIYGALLLSSDGNIIISCAAGPSVTAVTIPDSVTSIGEYALYNCRSLASVFLPISVEYIGESAFRGCISLNTVYNISPIDVELGSSSNGYLGYHTDRVLSIGTQTCGDNVYWAIDDNVLYVYGYGPMTDYTDSTQVPWYAFRTSLKSVEFAGNITSIGACTFQGLTSIDAVILPDSVETIGDYSFYCCISLESVYIPDTVTSIGSGAFSGCTSLDSFSGTYGGIYGELLMSPDGKTLVSCAAGPSVTTVTVPYSVMCIGEYAFYNCTSLESVSLPASVISIGKCAFSGCNSLTSVTLPSYIESIGENAFYGCTSLKTVYNISELSIEKGSSSYGYVGYYADLVISTGTQTCGDDVYWTIDDNVLYVYGYGAMADYTDSTQVPWYAFRTSLKSVEFARNVTSIGTCAFQDLTSLQSVSLSVSIGSIGDYAFYSCTSIRSVYIPDSVTSIGESAFMGCTSLESVSISDSVESIGPGAFSGCTSLTSFSGTYAGIHGALLLSPEGDTLVSYAAGSSDRSVTVTDTVTEVGDYAFYGCKHLVSVSLPDSLESIGYCAFLGCTSLTSVTIPSSVVSIGDQAFQSCTSLASVTLSPSVESIGTYTFYKCTSLKTVYDLSSLSIEKGSYTYGYIGYYADRIITPGTQTCGDDVYWILDGDVLCVYGYGAMTDYSFYTHVPWNSVCTSVKSVEFVGHVTTIGSYAFSGCTSLPCMNLPDSIESIGEYAFQKCTSLGSVSIPDSVVSIGSHSFKNCTSLDHVILPASITSIGAYAFQNCTSLGSVSIPDSVASIGAGAFLGCISLDSFSGSYAGISGALLLSPDGKTVVSCASGPSVIYVTVPGSVTSVGHDSFKGCTYLVSVALPSSVKAIDICAFSGCSSLSSVTFPGVVTIGDDAFSGCSSLSSVTLPSSVRYISSSAFKGCTALKTVYNLSDFAVEKGSSSYGYVGYYADLVLSAGTQTCGDGVYWAIDDGVLYVYGCGAMTDFKYGASSPWYKSRAEITSVSVGYGVTSVGVYAFYGCHELVNVELSDTVASIKRYAFRNTEVESISFGTGLKYVATDAFIGYTFCDGLIKNTAYKYMVGRTFEGSDNNFTTVTGRVGTGVTWSLDTVEGTLVLSGHGEVCDFIYRSLAPWYAFRGAITSIEVCEGVTRIGNNSFVNIGDLESITVSPGVFVKWNAFGSTVLYAENGITVLKVNSSNVAGHSFSLMGGKMVRTV